jgi:hypothetical protein
MGADLAIRMDPVQLARAAGITLYPWQVDAVRSPHKQQLWLASRQSGKSTTASVLATWTALAWPGSTVLLLAPALRQAELLFDKCLQLHRSAGMEAPADAATRLALKLGNGSVLRAIPGTADGKSIRGFSPNLIVFDEASRIPDDVFQAMTPSTAATRGTIVGLTTPSGRRGWFSDLWHGGGSDWRRTKIAVHDVPHVTADWLAQERRRIPARVFKAEYLVEFVEDEDQLFTEADIQAALTDDVTPLYAAGGSR